VVAEVIWFNRHPTPFNKPVPYPFMEIE
jgi:hypothetical protein